MRTLLAVLFCLSAARLMAISDPVEDVQVVTVTQLGSILIRFRNDNAQFPRGEGVCLYQKQKVAGCGHVTDADFNGVTVQITSGDSKFHADELLKMRATAAFARNDLRGYEFMNLGLGFGLDMGPQPSAVVLGVIQFAFLKHVTLGFQPMLMGGVVTVKDLVITGDYYFGRRFRNFFVSTGIGFQSMAAQLAPYSEGTTALVGQLGVGYRRIIAGTFNIGGTIGMQYLSSISTAHINLGVSQFGVLSRVEAGFLF